VKKSEKPRFYGQNKIFLENPAFQPFGSFSLFRKYMENELNTCFQQNSPRAQLESELGVLGVHGKLVKYVVHSSKRKN
jgi:hypothetical protein